MPAIRSHVAIPSRRETNRFLSFLRGGPPRLSLPSPSYPSLFIVPLRISALSAVLPIAPFLCDPTAPALARRFRKVFLCGSPRLLALRFVPRFWRAAQRRKKKCAYENIPGENKAISWQMRSKSSSGKDGSINLKY